jgi:hypothetical protein
VSGRLNFKTTELEKNLYVKKVATNIKGFPQEIVIVDKASIEKLEVKLRNSLFSKT